MKYSDLVRFKNGDFDIPQRDVFTKNAGDGVHIQQTPIIISQKHPLKAAKLLGSFILQKDAAGDGLWVSYIPKKSTFAYLSGKKWAASGPFSGCYFEIGKHDGKIYFAHISCEGANDPNIKAWKESPMGVSKEVWFSKKISMSQDLPSGATGAAAIVFANVIADNKLEVTRVDVQTKSPGSMKGKVFDVKKIESDPITKR